MFGLESDVGRFGSLVWCWCDESGVAEMTVDRRSRNRDLVVVFEVPLDCVCAGVEPLRREVGSDVDDQADNSFRCFVGAGVGSA